MLDGARGVLVAVSGGPDSVALLDMLVRISLGDRGWGSGVSGEQRGGPAEEQGSPEAPPPLCTSAPRLFCEPPSPRLRLHVAHLDHMLRARESAEDVEFVRALVDRLGLPITIRSVDIRAAASLSGRGLEEIAREIRYDFLLAAANEADCDRIAVGHTMTDQAETFLMRLIRGAGLRGLAAMRPVSPAHIFSIEGAEEGRGTSAPPPLSSSFAVSLIRPLLCITREEVESYCTDRSLEFRTDSTNLSLHYTRNRIRNDLMPALLAISPRAVRSIGRAAENIAGDQDVLAGLALSLLTGARLASEALRHVDDRSITAYSITALLEQPPGMRRRMIIEAIRLARAGVTVEEPAEITSAHIAAVENLLAANSSGKHVALPGGLEVWHEFEALVIKTIGNKKAPYQLVISSACPVVEAGRFVFTLKRGLAVERLKSVIEGTRREKLLTGNDWMAVALDDNALAEPLVIRPRRPGERAHVVGRRRTIKLKNLMIDHRIPSSRRASWPLVTTPDGEYIWSPGLPPALEFTAHDGSESLALVRASAI